MSRGTPEERIAFARDALAVFIRIQREVQALEARHPAVSGWFLAASYDELIDDLRRQAEQ